MITFAVAEPCMEALPPGVANSGLNGSTHRLAADFRTTWNAKPTVLLNPVEPVTVTLLPPITCVLPNAAPNWK
jgi:hypothetical protein